jgi:hypothetical protein
MLGDTAPPLRFGHEPRCCVYQVYGVIGCSEPQRVRSSGAANVEHRCRRSRGKALDQLAGPRFLQLEGTLLEPSFLGRVLVEGGDGRIEAVGRSVTHAVSGTRQTRPPSSDAHSTAMRPRPPRSELKSPRTWGSPL